MTRTFDLQTLSNLSWEIDIAAQVEANLDLFNAAGSSSAEETGGLYVTVTGGGVAAYTWTGTNTNIPVPEPGAGPLALAASGALAALPRRRG